jgi:cyanophycinase-like exopeptidase
MIVLMGSGELTATMVEVHKEILSRLGGEPKAVFLDTPAGFQLNADQLSQRAVEYFLTRVQHPMTVASFKSKDVSPFEAEKAYGLLKQSDYILVGPGSPTYAVRHWKDSPVPEIIAERIEKGGCLVAASAAALTVGRFTLPVYEIYKVGQELHWVEGMDVLGHFGLNYVVVPHWNNAEGGTHDTRCCFIGEPRFKSLASMLTPGVGVFGLDEHTACIIDFARGEAVIRGIGSVTIRYAGSEKVYRRGESFPVDVLRGKAEGVTFEAETQPPPLSEPEDEGQEDRFWGRVHSIEETFHKGLESDLRDATSAVLELDRIIWKAQQDLENPELITEARDLLRELIVLLGTRLASSPTSREECLAPLIEQLLPLRETFRKNKQWEDADALRDCLLKANIIVEDRKEGSHWHLTS